MKYVTAFWKGLTHNADGTFSSTKFWQAFGYVVASWVIVVLTMNDRMSAEYLLIYLGAVTAARSFQNYLVARGTTKQEAPNYDLINDPSLRPPREG